VGHGGGAGAQHRRHDGVLRLQEPGVALQRAEHEQRRDEAPDVAPRGRGDLRVLAAPSEGLAGEGPGRRHWDAHQREHKHGPLLVDAEQVVLTRAEGLPAQRVQAARHAYLARTTRRAARAVSPVARQRAQTFCTSEARTVRDVYQQAEAGDAGEGGGHGGAGELDLAEVSDEHDGDHLDYVLQEASGDERAGDAQLLLDLAQH
jgi:hypothetical protein